MKDFKGKKMAIQGDVAFTRMVNSDIPEGLVPRESTGDQLIVTHSETGHHHSFAADSDVALLDNPDNELESWLVVSADAKLKHHRSFDEHESIMFNPGVYRINRQREYTPEGYRRVQD